MAANIDDLITAVRSGSTNAPVTTVASSRSIDGTSLVCDDLTGWPTDTAIHLQTYKKTAAGTKDFTTAVDMKGIVSSNTIGSIVIENGTDAGNDVGDFVELAPTGAWAQDLYDGLTAEHNVDGTHGDVTATSVTTDTIKGKTASTLAIKDTSSNEYIKFSKTASAVNEVTVTNAATGNAPQISATGDDTNVDLRLVPKGTGNIKRGTSGGAIDWWEELGRTTLGSAGDTISVTGLSARKYLRILISGIQSGSIQASIQFNGDTGSNYSRNTSGANGAAFSASGSQTSALFTGAGVVNQWVTLDLMNISAQEKIGHYLATEGTTGAANAPNYRTGVIKWANTAAQITRVDVINVSTGDFAIGSEVVVLGHD